MTNPVGLYLWAGPGTIDLLGVKYPRPRIDHQGHMRAYDPDYLRQVQAICGVTDLWATFSWGFSEAREQPHRRFITERLAGIHRLGLRAIGYVQGFNVVTDDFRDRDFFCRDVRGKLLPYSRGRSLTCPNHPATVELIRQRVQAACESGFDAVFVDNILFGLPPFFVSQQAASFFGCACAHCRQQFRHRFGYELNPAEKFGKHAIDDYLTFRSESVFAALALLRQTAERHGKGFGVNLYDFHRHHSGFYFGYDFQKIEPLLDYYLFENHAFVNENRLENGYLRQLVTATDKPVFVVSYQNGIGSEKGFSQRQLDLIFQEAAEIGYAPCLKGGEFTTRGVWHVLGLEGLQRPVVYKNPTRAFAPLAKSRLRSKPRSRLLLKLLSRAYPVIMRLVYDNDHAHRFVHCSGLMRRSLRSLQNFDW